MSEDQRFEIERAFDLLPHVAGAAWATTWFRFNGKKNPTREEYRNKVMEYMALLDPLFESLSGNEGLEEIYKYIQSRKKTVIEQITNGLNKEIEKRYDRYVDYG
jgi:hypothetical protein